MAYRINGAPKIWRMTPGKLALLVVLGVIVALAVTFGELRRHSGMPMLTPGHSAPLLGARAANT